MSEKQIESIAECTNADIALWVGAVSAGKTIASLFAELGEVRTATGRGQIVIIGKTLPTIERNIIDVLQSVDIFGDLAAATVHTKGASTAIILGKEVHLIGANDARSEEKIRGMTIERAYVDEATLLPQAFWNMLITRMRVAGARILATTNPGSMNHWLRAEWILKATEVGMRVFHLTMDDNPGLDPAYVDRMKASFTGVFYDRFIKGLWTNAEGAVFDMWEPGKHVIPFNTLPRMQRILGVGIDYGTTNATSAVLLGLGVDYRLYAISEWRHDSRAGQPQLTNSAIVKGITDWLGTIELPDGTRPAPEWLIHDPSAASLRVEMASQGILNAFPANNEVLYGIQTVASVIDSDRFRVTDQCKGLVSEMPEYAWDPKATAKGEDKPLKVNDHSVDGLRYVVTSTETNWRPYLNYPIQQSA
jgi:PBSX family phage terminase large subunit